MGSPSVVLGGLLHLHQDPRRDLRRGHLLAVDLHPGIAVVRRDDLEGGDVGVALDDAVLILAPDQALDGKQGVLGIGNRLALGGLAHQDLAVVAKRHHRGGGAAALGVLDDASLPALHNGDAGIGRAEVNTDYLCHCRLSPFVSESCLAGPNTNKTNHVSKRLGFIDGARGRLFKPIRRSCPNCPRPPRPGRKPRPAPGAAGGHSTDTPSGTPSPPCWAPRPGPAGWTWLDDVPG